MAVKLVAGGPALGPVPHVLSAAAAQFCVCVSAGKRKRAEVRMFLMFIPSPVIIIHLMMDAKIIMIIIP